MCWDIENDELRIENVAHVSSLDLVIHTVVKTLVAN